MKMIIRKIGSLFAVILLLTAISIQPADAFIKWVEFKVPYSALEKAMKLDIESTEQEIKLNWTEILALLACKYGGEWSRYKESDLLDFAERLREGECLQEMSAKYEHYGYFSDAYDAVLGGLLGHYRVMDEVGNWEEKYGLRAFSPVAKGYYYTHSDDFGVGRNYGYQRRHLGHDMMCPTGTPVIAVETGRVEAMGWNQYGGWRVGIRSLDSRRYYYYAHLRKDRPFHADLKEGGIVKAGDVIGYVGRTGYSRNENVNNIEISHLHFGLQLIFDESQKEAVTEIWVDTYNIVRLLEKNRAPVYRVDETKEYYPDHVTEKIDAA